MHDLPSQTLLQQASARPVSGEELEVMGKHAADCYLCGSFDTLNEAVVETVKQAGLSPEQVKRVIEFANTSAYLQEFKKEGSHKYIQFHGGPANPSEVLKDLNDGGGGTVFDRGMADYDQPPPEMPKQAELARSNMSALGLEKTAASYESTDEAALREAFSVDEQEYPYADPWQDSVVMRDKLASAIDAVRSELSECEVDFMTICDDLYHQVKQASLNGVPLGHVLQAWSEVVPGPGFVKVAFQRIGPRLVTEEVLTSEEFAADLEKTASGLPNLDHPLVGSFSAFCLQLEKMAQARVALEELSTEHDRIDGFLKKAQGIVGAAKKGFGAAKQLARRAAPTVGKAVGGKPGEYAAKGVEYAPEALATLGALEAYDRAKYSPLGGVVRGIKARVPGTQEHYVRQAQLAQRWM